MLAAAQIAAAGLLWAALLDPPGARSQPNDARGEPPGGERVVVASRTDDRREERRLRARVVASRSVGRAGGLPAPGARCGKATARTVAFRVHVERGLGVDPAAFAGEVRAILCDRRGWTASGRVAFVYHPRAPVLVALRSPLETERRCLALVGRSVRMTYSCAGAREAVLNAARWVRGSATWPGTVTQYRALLVNHEVGHVLGRGHSGCRGSGRAPVMMQQSKGLHGCRPNWWPLPEEVRAVR